MIAPCIFAAAVLERLEPMCSMLNPKCSSMDVAGECPGDQNCGGRVTHDGDRTAGRPTAALRGREIRSVPTRSVDRMLFAPLHFSGRSLPAWGCQVQRLRVAHRSTACWRSSWRSCTTSRSKSSARSGLPLGLPPGHCASASIPRGAARLRFATASLGKCAQPSA